MRHEHAGLAIPDFPLAYGEILPDTSASALETINSQRQANDLVPTSAIQIWIQMAHRAVAVCILLSVTAVAYRTYRSMVARRASLWSSAWLLMILCQVLLGAWTIWSNKAADVATAHMALGALSLFLGVIFCFRLHRGVQAGRFVIPDTQPLREFSSIA
jgi:cytochrome c oxidase assembly protein subunit 15